MQPVPERPDDVDGYEIFRRAIVERDNAAWAEGIAQYRGMLIGWARRHAGDMSHDCCCDIADRAIARAWVALTPERFAQFPTLAALLAYLQRCVASEAMDNLRRERSAERLSRALPAGEVATPEQVVLDRLDRDELWRIVGRVARTEPEHVIIEESFVHGLPPRAILARYPRLFANVTEVYSTKRNIFERLQRCDDLRQLY